MNVSIEHPTDRPNFSRVEVNEITIYFSYRTPIAFHHPATGQVIRENIWGPTTGKHLNWIDNGYRGGRVSGAEFEKKLKMVLGIDYVIEEYAA